MFLFGNRDQGVVGGGVLATGARRSGTVKSVKEQVKVISKVTVSIRPRSPLPIETSDFSHSGPDLLTHPESLFLLIEQCFQVAGYPRFSIGITMNLSTGYVNISTKLDVILNVGQSINILTKGLTETIPVSCFQATLQRFNGFMGPAFHRFGGGDAVNIFFLKWEVC